MTVSYPRKISTHNELRNTPTSHVLKLHSMDLRSRTFSNGDIFGKNICDVITYCSDYQRKPANGLILKWYKQSNFIQNFKVFRAQQLLRTQILLDEKA